MYKRPESVLVVVTAARSAETLLLLRHRPRGFWQSVTGSLRPGETPSAAARRELLEETGLSDVQVADTGRSVEYPLHPEWRPRYAPGTENNREYQFVCELPRPVAVMRSQHEHRGYAWLSVVEAARRVSSASNREALLSLSAMRTAADTGGDKSF